MTFKEEEEEEEGEEGKKKEELKVLARGTDKMELPSIVKEKRTSADTGLQIKNLEAASVPEISNKTIK